MRKILVVGMPNSIHTARWVNQLTDQNWKVYLFPSMGDVLPHPDINDQIILLTSLNWLRKIFTKIKCTFIIKMAYQISRFFDRKFPTFKIRRLIKLIDSISPDLIHSLEMQSAGYLVLDSKMMRSNYFPKWWVTNWGSDIYYFQKFKEHLHKLKKVLSECDFYSSECERDVRLARKLGFKGVSFPVQPNAGGFDLSYVRSIRQTPTSQRRLIMLKGYQGWAGRALVGLAALEQCADVLKDYEVCIYSASEDVISAAKLFEEKTNILVREIPPQTSHNEMLKLHSQARVSIGLSITDGISTSLLEAIITGSFPIQSCTACAEEWIVNGKTGMIVTPENSSAIAKCIKYALSNDDLVDSAANLNWQVALDRLDKIKIRSKTLEMYNSIFADTGLFGDCS